MASVVRMPSVLADATEAAIANWLVGPGDKVAVGDPMVEIETEKAIVEYQAEEPGIVGRLVLAAGEAGEVGAAMAVLIAEGETDADIDAALGRRGGRTGGGDARSGGGFASGGSGGDADAGERGGGGRRVGGARSSPARLCARSRSRSASTWPASAAPDRAVASCGATSRGWRSGGSSGRSGSRRARTPRRPRRPPRPRRRSRPGPVLAAGDTADPAHADPAGDRPPADREQGDHAALLPVDRVRGR